MCENHPYDQRLFNPYISTRKYVLWYSYSTDNWGTQRLRKVPKLPSWNSSSHGLTPKYMFLTTILGCLKITLELHHFFWHVAFNNDGKEKKIEKLYIDKFENTGEQAIGIFQNFCNILNVIFWRSTITINLNICIFCYLLNSLHIGSLLFLILWSTIAWREKFNVRWN